ncbi:phosphotransferase [Lactovum miscens]|uniref:Aminoglycoside phosphotransferase (APT) family kinase protein n=1 Tax=Lactovum miscens TaxID=190387 RepID=A0A841C6Q2_9LACT|nr:phosphotransferase [Lactovum miscens]MBB5887957.1 aminoglycoside phosphotransferase (APT) family kinase protein [Lactovum miscens]
MTKVIDEFIQSRFPNLDGKAVNPGNYGNPKKFARDLGHFLHDLQNLSTIVAPRPSFENYFAGSELVFFEAEMNDLLSGFKNLVPKNFMGMTFDLATKKAIKKQVWVHGNFVAKNIFVKDGELSGVLGLEKAVVGDPACDLAIAWSLFDSHVRKIFFGAAEVNQATIDRARMHAMRLALKTYNSNDIDEQIMARDAMSEILDELGYHGQDELFDDHIPEGDVNGIPGTL